MAWNKRKNQAKATIISSGNPIGMNVTKAAKKGLLQAGDIIANSSFNHTYVYADTKMEKSSYMKLVEMQVVQVTEKLAAAHFLLDSIIT